MARIIRGYRPFFAGLRDWSSHFGKANVSHFVKMSGVEFSVISCNKTDFSIYSFVNIKIVILTKRGMSEYPESGRERNLYIRAWVVLQVYL